MTVARTSTIIYGSSQFVDVAQLIPSCRSQLSPHAGDERGDGNSRHTQGA